MLDGTSQHFSASTTYRLPSKTQMFQLTSGGKYGLFSLKRCYDNEARLLTSSADAAEMTGELVYSGTPASRWCHRKCPLALNDGVCRRRLFFNDMVHNSTRGDIDLLYMHAYGSRVFICDEEMCIPWPALRFRLSSATTTN